MYLSKKAKIIIWTIIGVLITAGAIGGSIAIANAVKKNKQEKCAHVYGIGEVTVEAACETPGVIVYTCEACDYELTEEIPANGHVETEIEAVAATCTAKGFTDGIKCVTCEKVLVAPTETPLLGHKVEALKAVAATCTTSGKTEGAKCSRCGEIQRAQTLIPAKGHNVVEVKGEAPTCTESGKTNGSTCTGCGQVYSGQEIIPALGHSDANGDGVCDVCGEPNTETSLVWQLCSDEAELKAGDKIIIVAQSQEYALSGTQSASNRPSAEISKNGTTASIGDDVQIIVLEDGIVQNTFALNVGTGYLYAPSSSSNQLKTRDFIDGNASWLITIDPLGVATIAAQGESAKNKLMYNETSNLFSCYESEQSAVVIYKQIEI